MPSRRSNKSGKSSLGAPTGWQSCSSSSAKVAFGGFVPPGRRPIIKEFQITNQTNQTNQTDQSDERSTTPMGRRPGEFTPLGSHMNLHCPCCGAREGELAQRGRNVAMSSADIATSRERQPMHSLVSVESLAADRHRFSHHELVSIGRLIKPRL